jgi:dihydroorotate dehydrogenase
MNKSFIFVAMYLILRRLLFLFDPEDIHYFAMNLLKLACSLGFARSLLRRQFLPAKTKPTSLFGLSFRNNTGLAAGFDKNAKYLDELEVLGFGFVEIGTVTPRPQAGNEKPRLFRLPEDKALVNRMGFNNEGVKAVVQRLIYWRAKQKAGKQPDLIVGGNIGKNKITTNEDAWKDYEICFRELYDYVDYFVVNVSSPNTPGLRELQEKDALKKILSHLQTLRQQQAIYKPLLLKIAPDLSNSQLDDVIDLAIEIKLDGLVATNTTIERKQLNSSEEKVNRTGAGGLSGLPLKNRSTEVIKYISDHSAGKIPVIGSGGIFNATDAKEKLLAGASLLQVWTGFVYEGPGIVKKIINRLNLES